MLIKKRGKIFSFIMLVTFAFVLMLGTVVVGSDMSGVHSGNIGCFGAPCGPVEHVTQHVFISPSILKIDIAQFISFFSLQISIAYQNIAIFPTTPPPRSHS